MRLETFTQDHTHGRRAPMIAHGTYSKYVHDGCRCTECTAAATESVRKARLRRHEATAANAPPSSVAHGHSAYVNWGCRCDVCCAASAEYGRAHRSALVAEGEAKARRRTQELIHDSYNREGER